MHPERLTWNPTMEVWKMMFLSNWVIFMFHVNFQGCVFSLDVAECWWLMLVLYYSLQIFKEQSLSWVIPRIGKNVYDITTTQALSEGLSLPLKITYTTNIYRIPVIIFLEPQ